MTSQAEYSRRQAAIKREVGPLPKVKHPRRKSAAKKSLRKFCETYHRSTFFLDWSDDHLTVLRKLESAVLHGGLFALAMPRASGKSAFTEVACEWAILSGHHEFVALIGADEEHAKDMLDSIKTDLEENDLLYEDFPEVCHPIRALDGIANRCSGQTLNGKRTHITWTANEIVLPTAKGSKASAAVIRVRGITGRIRGMKHKRPDGRIARPSLVIIDDPQTDQSAQSPSQCYTRQRVLSGAILGLAGPTTDISAVMPCTIIRPGDLADEMLNQDKHPEWNGERTKLLYALPKNLNKWDEYAEIRAESFRRGNRGEEATEFYREHQTEMDEGAIAAWPARFNKGEISAIQYAMNIRLRDPQSFDAEYQNSPQLPGSDVNPLTVDDVFAKLNHVQRYIVPADCSYLTGYVDVQKSCLYYVITAWENDFTGHVIDYGSFPDQQREYFTLREVRRTLARQFPNAREEGAIFSGLTQLVSSLFDRVWRSEGGVELSFDNLSIDAGWQTDTVHRFCRSQPNRPIVPAMGFGIGAGKKPFSEYRKNAGDRAGLHWRYPMAKRALRTLHIDTNYWKTFVHNGLETATGDKGSLYLYGSDERVHRMLCDHILSEYRRRTHGHGRDVDEWKAKPGQDNHLFDCLVGAATVASFSGCSVEGIEKKQQAKPKQKRTLAEMRAARRRLVR